MLKRIFLIVLDSVGIGEAPDAAAYGDQGSHTLRACWNTGKLDLPNLTRLGLFNIEGIGCGKPDPNPIGSYAKMREASAGKDTTTGHWEIGGLISKTPMPTYPHGFPPELIEAYSKATGRPILCNQPYSGTQVIHDYGREQMEKGALIVYTSADSVFQVAAHEQVVPVEELYQDCLIARKMLVGEHGVGRVIARPFEGTWPNFTRTSRRHDFSLLPPKGHRSGCFAGRWSGHHWGGKNSGYFRGEGNHQLCPHGQQPRRHGQNHGIRRSAFPWAVLCESGGF